MKRVFVGIKISEALRNQVYDWQKAHFYLPVRFLARLNLHVTLIPPWQIEDDELPALKSRLSDFRGNLRPFNLFFDRVSLGPQPNNPRLVWATGEVTPELMHLRDMLENKIVLLDSRQPLRLHLTVARFKPGHLNFQLDEDIYWPETVEAIALYESVWDMSGAEYPILEEILFE